MELKNFFKQEVPMTSKPFLFREYPELEEKIEWVSLGDFPTPVHRIENLEPNNLWVKRDDQSCTLYGGNKIRKLEFIVGDIQKKNKKHVVTMGGIGTNHGLATAVICDKLGLECTLLLFKQPVTSHVKENLLLFKKFNAETLYRGSLWNTVWAYYLFERIKTPRAYFLFAGGSTVLGTIGYVNAVFELKDQIEKGEVPEPECIFCPLGSNGTVAGIALGVLLTGLKSKVTGVRVTASHLGPFPASTPGTVKGLMKQVYRYLKKLCNDIPDVKIEAPHIENGFFGGAYGMPIEKGIEAMELCEEKAGLKLEPTYTAKTFAALLDHCCSSKNMGPVLYWNTCSSVDLSRQAASVNCHDLPQDLQVFLEADEIIK